MDYAEKMQRCTQYMEALEEERRKIQVFQRELPLCLDLVTQAIEACGRELSGTTTTTTENMQAQTHSECSEQTTSKGPVLEEFIPIKRSCTSDNDNDDDDDDEDGDDDDDGDDDNEQQSRNKHKSHSSNNNSNSDMKKSEWLRSVQLWNQSPDPPSKEDVPRKAGVVEVKRSGGAFQPFHREKSAAKNCNNQSSSTPKGSNNNSTIPAAAASSTTAGGNGGSNGNSKKEEKEQGQTQRKQRRCWSPELHRRFLHALQQLGGSHAATPKQIRELMKVDGLTNDEVKSHLQKYRLHTRRPTPTVHHSNGNPQAPQFVVVGGIWVPPPEYAAVAAATTASGEVAATNGIYAPVAAPAATVSRTTASLIQRPQQTQSEQLHSEERGSHSAGRVHSNSPATSSSTHTS